MWNFFSFTLCISIGTLFSLSHFPPPPPLSLCTAPILCSYLSGSISPLRPVTPGAAEVLPNQDYLVFTNSSSTLTLSNAECSIVSPRPGQVPQWRDSDGVLTNASTKGIVITEGPASARLTTTVLRWPAVMNRDLTDIYTCVATTATQFFRLFVVGKLAFFFVFASEAVYRAVC